MEPNHLVLLMGMNPLPNYVVAKYFLKRLSKFPTIWVLCSSDTRLPAERLGDLLSKEASELAYEYCDLDDPGDAGKIEKNLNDQILQNINSGDSLHLNYTGGTKSMVVQSYATITKKLAWEKLSFSYLDADKFRLRFDDGDISNDLRDEIAIEFDELLNLHDCKKKYIGSEADWSTANEIITSFIRKKRLPELMEWIYAVIHPHFFQKNKRKKPAKFYKDWMKYDQNGKAIPFHREIWELLNSFPEKQQWKFDQQDLLIILDTESQFARGDGTFVKGIRYLHGLWLEYYISNFLKAKIEVENRIFKLFHNWHIVKGAAEKEFEIDSMLLYGYHLCAISITSSNEEWLCKSKGFEILHRARQMGGDEARSVLITTLMKDKIEKITNDLELSVGSNSQLLILGVDDLENNKVWIRIQKHIIEE